MSARRLHATPTGIIAVVVGAGLVLLLVHAFQSSNSERTDSPQPIALVAPPAAPPPEAKQPLPLTQRELPAPSDSREWSAAESNPGAGTAGPGPASIAPTGPLGLNEAGGAGGDAFGLAGRPGGRELLAGGGGGGNPNARVLQFADALQSQVRQQLRADVELRHHCFVVEVDVWVSPSGTLQRARLHGSSGNRGLDGQIQAAFDGLQPFTAAPPPEMPWPVRLRVTSERPDCH